MPSLADLTARLALYRAAEEKILRDQEHTISDGGIQRRVRRADLAEVRAAIKELQTDIEKIEAQQSGARRVLYLRPGR